MLHWKIFDSVTNFIVSPMEDDSLVNDASKEIPTVVHMSPLKTIYECQNCKILRKRNQDLH